MEEKIFTLRQLYKILKSSNLKSCFDDGVVIKTGSGFTYSLRDCIVHDKFVGLPDFDSKSLLADDIILNLKRQTMSYVTDQIRRKSFWMRNKKQQQQEEYQNRQKNLDTVFKLEDNIEVNVDHALYYSYPLDCYADLHSFIKTGNLQWKSFKEIHSCCKCLGLLKQPVNVSGRIFYASRPDARSVDTTDTIKGDYTTFCDSSSNVMHLVDWADNHGLSQKLGFLRLNNFYPGFRHLSQQYHHIHYHYLGFAEYDDPGWMQKGKTNSIGQYVTSAFLENFSKLHKHGKKSFRSMTGCFPFFHVYHSFVNNFDLLLYQCLCVQIIFGIYGNFDRSQSGVIKFLDVLVPIIQRIDLDLMNAIIYGPLPVMDKALGYYREYYGEYLTNYAITIIETDDYAEERVRLSNEAKSFVDLITS